MFSLLILILQAQIKAKEDENPLGSGWEIEKYVNEKNKKEINAHKQENGIKQNISVKAEKSEGKGSSSSSYSSSYTFSSLRN